MTVSSRPDAVLPAYAVFNFDWKPDDFVAIGVEYQDCIAAVTDEVPPVFLWTTDEDQTVPPERGADGDNTPVIAIKRDLTRQRQLEEQFVQAHPQHPGRVGLLLTSDEEGPANMDGVRKLAERFRAIGNPISTIVAELLDFFMEYHKDEKWGFIGAPLHDPCTIAWFLKPELFTTVERWVGVETQGKYTQGMTVVDYYFLSGNKPNATVMVDVDREGFVDLLAERLKFYA